jgi:hypothetical protein
MTIYVKNTTPTTLKFPYRGEVYLFVAEEIMSLDEIEVPYSLISRIYGWKNLYQIESPSGPEIAASIPALQVYVTGISAEAELLISSNFGMEGDKNCLRKQYKLMVQAFKDAAL